MAYFLLLCKLFGTHFLLHSLWIFFFREQVVFSILLFCTARAETIGALLLLFFVPLASVECRIQVVGLESITGSAFSASVRLLLCRSAL